MLDILQYPGHSLAFTIFLDNFKTNTKTSQMSQMQKYHKFCSNPILWLNSRQFDVYFPRTQVYDHHHKEENNDDDDDDDRDEKV